MQQQELIVDMIKRRSNSKPWKDHIENIGLF